MSVNGTKNLLAAITADKEARKVLNARIKTNVADAFKEITQRIKAKRESDKVYKEATKATLIKLIKLELDSKEDVINTACNVMLLGLSLDNTLSLSTIKYTIKLVKDGRVSKAKVNKLDKEGMQALVKAEKAKDKLS